MGAAYESKYHPDLITLPRSLAEFFADRAKLLLESELESPSLAAIQTLVILSAYEASCTRDTRGWLYSGKYGVPRDAWHGMAKPEIHTSRNGNEACL